MRKPTAYRPAHDEQDWDDNAVSNVMAWGSSLITPGWCKSETHWTARLADKLWSECACCLLFRGVFLGAIVGACLALPLGVLLGLTF